MGGGLAQSFSVNLIVLFLLLLCLHESGCTPANYLKGSVIMDRRADALLPEISPTVTPQPLLPLLAPSPLTPFTNSSKVPKLSGLCKFNFTALGSILSMTSTDCMAGFAPYLANVVCCPQLDATLVVLIGQSSKITNTLALNATLATHCLSDLEKVLVSQGANDSLPEMCSIHPSNLTQGSCPVNDVSEFESTIDSSNLLASCEKIDVANECCEQVCENAITEAANKLAEKGYHLLSLDETRVLSDHSTRVGDCRSVVLRWLASKLDPSHAKDILRGLSTCKINEVCPLDFPKMSHLIKGCGNGISNETACCIAVNNYVARLQKQSFVTNLQALNCAASLGRKLRKANISENIYDMCDIGLKDFSLQAGTQEQGCLLPSLPYDVVLDQSAGISFLCDLNDNIPAPWPSTSQLPSSSCNKTVKIPALPAAASGQNRLDVTYRESHLLLVALAAFVVLM